MVTSTGYDVSEFVIEIPVTSGDPKIFIPVLPQAATQQGSLNRDEPTGAKLSWTEEIGGNTNMGRLVRCNRGT